MRADGLPCYQVAGQVIASEFELPAFASARSSNPAWTVRLARGPWVGKRPRAYQRCTDAAGRPWLSFARLGGDRLLTFPRLADVRVSHHDRELQCFLPRDGSLAVLTVLVQNHVLPLVLGGEQLVLHASAVSGGTGAIAFVGPSGSGKSTLAAFLGRRGYQVVADDALVIAEPCDGSRTVPTGASLRLWHDSLEQVLNLTGATLPRLSPRSHKRLVPLSVAGLEACLFEQPLDRIYLLTPRRQTGRGRTRSPRIQRVAGCAAAMQLLRWTFLMKLDEPAEVQRTFEHVTRLAATVPISSLELSDAFEDLPAVEAMIRENAKNGR